VIRSKDITPRVTHEYRPSLNKIDGDNFKIFSSRFSNLNFINEMKKDHPLNKSFSKN